MRESFKIATVFGIPIELHILFIMLMAFVLGVGLLTGSLGFFIYLSLLFLTVMLHELAHSAIAIMKDVKINKISLLPFGGVASLEKLPEDPRDELLISLAGPGFNFLFAGVSYIVIALIPGASSQVFPFFTFRLTGPVDLLILNFKINVLLGAFNLFIPALPMDGGRVLRALLALKIGFSHATNLAADIAKVIAILMFTFGLFYNWWLIVIAFFIYIGASQEVESMQISRLLGGITVEDVMSREVIDVPEDMNLEEFSDTILKYRHMGYPVTREGLLVGIITFTDLAKNPKTEWKNLKVGDVMTREVVTVSPQDSIVDVLTKMMQIGIGRVPVVENKRIVGIVSKKDIVRTAQIMKLRS
jgi:CBS domain-containing protein